MLRGFVATQVLLISFLDGGNTFHSRMAQLVALLMAMVSILAVTAEAGYIDLFKDANFKNTLLRVDNVLVDVCYNFKCDRLNDVISSATWHGLPEKGSLFQGGDAVISFITDSDCSGGEVRRWPISTQSKSPTNFPVNFKLDGIGGAISSFKVWNTGTDGGLLNICSASESAVILNATTSKEE